MMVQAKRIYILMIKVNKLFFFFSLWCFLKEIENMFSVFLSGYRNTHESLGNSIKLWKHSPSAYVPTAFLVLPNFHSCFYKSIETQYMFSISQKKKGLIDILTDNQMRCVILCQDYQITEKSFAGLKGYTLLKVTEPVENRCLGSSLCKQWPFRNSL